MYKNGRAEIELPENPTVLQVKHELSHYLDFKKVGLEAFVELGRPVRETLVLERLQRNRIWGKLNNEEQQFSIDYVNRLKKSEQRFEP